MFAAFAYNRLPRTTGDAVRVSTRASAGMYILVLATALLMGLRYQVGGDWVPYLNNYEQAQLYSFSNSISRFESGYATLVFLAGRLDAGIWLSNLGCAVIMTLGISRFCARQPNPALSFLVAIPYLVIVVGMGYTRQGVAIGLILAGLADADGRKIWKLVLYITAAALFHRAALVVLPMALSPLLRRNALYAIIGGVVSVALFYLILDRSTDELVNNYVNNNYESSGATVRVAMNIAPAILAIFFRKRLRFNAYQSDMWTAFAIVAVSAMPLVIFAEFSTAIDRLALFLIPIQIAILPRLPYIFSDKKLYNAQIFLIVVMYSAIVQLVWLVFAAHAALWVPYQAYFIDTQL